MGSRSPREGKGDLPRADGASGKPANVIDKIVEGKLGSFYAQVVLPDQPSIRDPKMTVADVIAAASKALGAHDHGLALRAAERSAKALNRGAFAL